MIFAIRFLKLNADLVTVTEENLHGKIPFVYSIFYLQSDFFVSLTGFQPVEFLRVS